MPRYLLLLLGVLVSVLVLVSMIYIWMPDMISEEVFVRILMTFGVIGAGSVVMSLLGGILAKSAPFNKPTDDKKP